ncbi:uncharacterized protein DDB_G0283697 [Octopus bimaculoides]|uniref:FYVE-type domain-containing protein n=1 Tax=Octopus bimaculoides TaxID=37653 RepID=A0A0L8GRU2_OCTBM|nr:uncharacterized protein DDB_G0283697 [Octopus bimaculoides]XP_014778596.1 uncharacterized protein DDB_G0283697 [Octopus bimaculoides]XP_052833597.1 uncharacterized protein DDB_G0283697 [Octopus bimaculoides]|eukprot:XP_014778595.1 PREDICTED: uncharacterized protein DDB_G0283697-like [Octopus bimaculoides]
MSSGGQCYSCGAEFGIFRKEHGCKNCGFVFCSKCLGKKIEVPRLNNSKGSVCNRCFTLLKGGLKTSSPPSSGPSTPQQFPPSPPLAYKKRMEALKVRESQTTSTHSNTSKKKPTSVPAMYHGMSKADIEIAERLERLRERPKCEVETEEQLEHRLAAIKGMDPSRYKESKNNKSVVLKSDRRTQQEQIDDLLEEIASSVALEASLPDPDAIIQQRLDQLRQDDDQHHRHRKKSNDDDDDDNGGGGGGGGSRTSSANSSIKSTSTTTTINLSSVTSSSSNNNNNNYNSQIGALPLGRTSTDNLSSSSPSARKPTPPSNRAAYFKDTSVTTNTNTTRAEAKDHAVNTNTNTNTNTLSLSEFLSNNLNKASCGPDKQPYEKNINFGSDTTYEGFDAVNINALMTEVKQVKEEVERNLKRSGSDNVMRAGDRKSWKNFDYTEADLQKEADEVARRLTAEALREKEDEEKNKQ